MVSQSFLQFRCVRTPRSCVARVSLRTVLVAAFLSVLAASSAAEVGVYTAATPAVGARLSPNTFEPFSPANIPGRVDVPEPSFRAQFAYSGRDWQVYSEPAKPGRRPDDPGRYQRIVLSHRTVPVALAVSFEIVEAAADADPVTLAKILRYNREADAKFRLLNETPHRLAGVDGTQAEYVQLRQKKLARVRHWITQYNGVVCQLELIAPYEHPELMALGGANGFPVLLEFLERTRNRPVLKDTEIPRKFVSPYGYRVDLGEGEWIPDGHDPYVRLAEYVAYTRNQGGIAVVPFSSLGQDVDTAALIETVIWLAEFSRREMIGKPTHVVEGKLEGLTFDTLSGDEDEMIRTRAKAVYSSTHAYLAVAWINTNSSLGPEVLDQWLNKVSFAQEAVSWPTNAHALSGFRERDRHAMGFFSLGQYYAARKDFDRSVAVLRTAMDCRFLPQILAAYARSQHRRGHPEEIVSYLKGCGPIVLRQGWVALGLAFAESRCGDFGSAAAHYSQCLASGGYSVGDFPPDCFEDYIRCLIKADRLKWASDRLAQRIAVDPSPLWPRMQGELKNGQLARSAATTPAVAARATVAPTPKGPPQLKSIIWNPGMPSVQLDQNLVFEGDRMRGYKVVKILQTSVDLLTPEGVALTLRSQ